MIFTFYSYKGGVGRSMALANIAELFYQDGYKVLMVDWDLEAPGLERYFPIEQDKVLSQRGLFDMILSYKARMSYELEKSEPLNLEEPKDLIVDIYPTTTKKGNLYLLTAGERSKNKFSSYSQAVISFDWIDFYENWEGEIYFEWLRQQFESIADIILIDSRTGVTEIGGVCTYQMADSVIMCCAPNYQNIHGTHEMAVRLMSPELHKLRAGRPLDIIILPSRIERADSHLLDKFKRVFLDTFKGILFPMKINVEQLWDIGISYVPKYALAELVAIREEREENLASAEVSAFEFRELGAILQKISEGENGLLTTMSQNEGFEIKHSKFNKYRRLTELTIIGKKLINIPPDIFLLKNLQVLDLSNNQLTTVPLEIAQLAKLQVLNLRNNRLADLPFEITQLRKLEVLYLEGNASLPIPPEIIAQGEKAQVILDYLRQRSDKSRQLNEVKLILIGEGGVGKTSLVKRIMGQGVDKEETQTTGINISSLSLEAVRPLSGVAPITLHIWDFGGQEIYYATHQFFLTTRSLYLVVISGRGGEKEGRLHHWLRLVNSLSEEAPVIVVVNKVDAHRAQLDERGLQNEYRNIVGFAYTSCTTGEGIGALREQILAAANQIPHVHSYLPSNWFALKEKLETMTRDFISYDQYIELCNEVGINDENSQRNLVRVLHNLGIVLSFQDDRRLEDTQVLNPNWVTQGIYQILTSAKAAGAGGVLTYELLDEVLDKKTYPRRKQPYLLDIMAKFEICFPIPDQNGRFLVPDLLPKTQPDLGTEWAFLTAATPTGSLAFELHYDFLPSSVLSRLMVRLMNNLDRHLSWRHGAVLHWEENRALVRANEQTSKLLMWIIGVEATRRSLLNVIREHLASIHNTFPNLQVTEAIPLPGYPGHTVSYQALLNHEKRKRLYYNGELDIEFDAAQLLGGIETPTIREERELYQLLLDNFNQAELRELCFKLGIAYEDLAGAGAGKRTAVLELVTQMKRHGRLPELGRMVRQERPFR